jgi:hypothetical protein
MDQQLINETERRTQKYRHVVLAGVIFTVFMFIGLSAASFEGPVTLMPSPHADSAWPIGPADMQVAQRYGRIDHSSVNSPGILPEPNLVVGATIAAYETPPE